jgi:FMN phosphatase YigB (HAD superfamily)
MYPDVKPLLSKLRGHLATDSGRVVVGVITNSDDRTPDIIASLGLRIRSLRYGEASGAIDLSDAADIDFAVISYDVGHEKPDKHMFAAAESLAINILAQNGGESTETLPGDWKKIYVGDEYDKDVIGSLGAGWQAVMIDRETRVGRDDVDWCDEREPSSFEELFARASAVGFSSLAKLAGWLPTRAS